VTSEAAVAFLRAAVDPARPVVPGRTVLVVAHPDDETLGCGALLSRLSDLTIVHVTDGAPRRGEDAARAGFSTPEAYAEARRSEVRNALLAGEAGTARLVTLGVADQGAAFDLVEITSRLLPLLSEADVVLTHAFEGGHPDHDATAFAVGAAVELLAGGSPALVEFPLYRAGPDGDWIRQAFDSGSLSPYILELTEVERARKARMIAAFTSQAKTLQSFGAADERFRQAPACDFAALPNGGNVLYERYGWGLTGQNWRQLAAAALSELGVGRVP
jgi:LmbE family N-acetylglucosaminyl deacetylase